MYRILRPNGQWIAQSFDGDLDTLEGAIKRAQQFARAINDYGEYLIYDGFASEPSARTSMIPLTEDDDA